MASEISKTCTGMKNLVSTEAKDISMVVLDAKKKTTSEILLKTILGIFSR